MTKALYQKTCVNNNNKTPDFHFHTPEKIR